MTMESSPGREEQDSAYARFRDFPRRGGNTLETGKKAATSLAQGTRRSAAWNT
jgi:hypothetical protein